MTREEAIRELKADYCGNRIICELHPDKCNQEECEIWLAIKALETQPEVAKDTNVLINDCISRQAAIDAANEWLLDCFKVQKQDRSCGLIRRLEDLLSAQPDITPDGTLTVSIDADIANVGRILLSQTGTQRGGLYYKDAQPEIIRCKDRYGYISIETLLNFCENSKDHSVTPNDFMRMKRVRMPEHKTGEWITSDDMYETGICSCCRYDTQEPVSYVVTNFVYCPNCGAKMEKSEDIPMEYFENGGM